MHYSKLYETYLWISVIILQKYRSEKYKNAEV